MNTQFLARVTILAAACIVLTTIALGQNVDRSRVFPITSPVKNAGVYNLETGRFHPSPPPNTPHAQLDVFDNTCNNASGFWYLQAGTCDDIFDEGRVPASGPLGATPDNSINHWEIGYCTAVATGSVDIDWELFDTTVGGTDACNLFSSGVPQDFSAGILSFDSSAAGFPLPGSTTGAVTCWLVAFSTSNPACLASGPTSTDLFNWRFRDNNTPAQSFNQANGPIIAGDQTVLQGAGTYNIPHVIDPISGNPCGSGLDERDQFWTNVDGSAIGNFPPPSCVNSPFLGTNCYWFGGSPTNPFGGMYFEMGSIGSCACTGNVTVYCTSKVNSLGCLPNISTSGTPSMSSSLAFQITVANLLVKNNWLISPPGNWGKHLGLWMVSKAGPTAVAYQGGFLCLKPPIHTIINGLMPGTEGTCNAAASKDFNAYMQSAAGSWISITDTVEVQFRQRDGFFTWNPTNAVQFSICP